jgi:hypothetical protein
MLLLQAVEVESCSVLVLDLIAVQRVDSQQKIRNELNGRGSTCFAGKQST